MRAVVRNTRLSSGIYYARHEAYGISSCVMDLLCRVGEDPGSGQRGGKLLGGGRRLGAFALKITHAQMKRFAPLVQNFQSKNVRGWGQVYQGSLPTCSVAETGPMADHLTWGK